MAAGGCEWVADCPVSTPLYLPGVKPEADMGGVKFSSQVGLFYTPGSQMLPIKLPPPIAEEKM